MNELDPKAVRYYFSWLAFLLLFFWIPLLIIAAFVTGFVAAAAQAASLGVNNYVLFGLVAAGVLVIYLLGGWWYAKLWYKNFRWQLTENEYRQDYGVIFKSHVAIPFDRIQNVNIVRDPFARRLGLAVLAIETAGAVRRRPEATIPGLAQEAAEKLRDELLRRSRGAKNHGM